MKVDMNVMFQLMIMATFLTSLYVFFYYSTCFSCRKIKFKVFSKLEKGNNSFFRKLTVKDYTSYEKLNIWWYCSQF